MITKALRKKIEDAAEYIRNTNNFFIAADRGQIKPNHIQYFLNSLAFIVPFTVPCLKQAINNTTDDNLSRFLKEKIHEEDGHGEWAFDNLQALGGERKVDLQGIHQNLQSLLDYLLLISNTDAKKYLLYLLTAEYILILNGPKLVNDLQNKCGILPSQISILISHVELDKGHVEDDLKICEQVFKEDYVWNEIESVIDTFVKYINGFYNDIMQMA